jgi:flagellin
MSVINTNVQALGAQKSLYEAERSLSTAMERLSTGKRINSAADDASGLSIATRMTSQVKGLNMAIRNANDGISLVQTTEGALSEVTDMLQRMRELAIQATNGTANASDRAALDAEVQQLKAEIDRIATTTKFNNQAILDGSFKNKVLQIGDSADATVGVAIASAKVADLGMGNSGAGGDSIVSARIGLTTSTTMEAGDVEINGQALAAIASGSDIEDLINNINNNVDNVTASGFNVVVAKNAGNGVTTVGQFQLQVTALGASVASTYYISASNSMDELVANINAEAGGVVTASVNDQGKLVLSNETGATIAVNDVSGTASSYDGASGFYDSGTSGTFSSTYGTYTGFLKLTSDDGSAIRVEAGNAGLTSPGTETDLAVLGFREVSTEPENEHYTTTGLALVSTSVSTAWGMSDITINGVQIYDEDVASTSFQGKLNAINNFTDETGVTASAYYEKTYDTTEYSWDNGAVMINGVTVRKGATLAAFATNINAATSSHGLVATVNGKNLTLSGANVQSVDIDQVDPNTVISLGSYANAIQSTSASARSITIVTADIVAGRTLTVYARGIDSATQGRGFAAHYTVKTGDSITAVAQGLTEAIVASQTNPSNPTAAAAGAYAVGASNTALITASGTTGAITFAANAGYGTAELGLMVTEKTSNIRMVSNVSGGAVSAADLGINILTGDLVAGRILELRIFNGVNRGGKPVNDIFVRHTVTSTDTITTVAAALVTEIEKTTSQATFAGKNSGFTGSAGEVYNTAGVITISSDALYGAAWGEVVAINPTFGESDTTYGRIRLDASNNTPIQIALGDSATVAEHGFLEMNAGAADYEVNAPTLGAGGGASLSGMNIMTVANANKAISALDNAIQAVSNSRSSLGALENRLSHTVDNLSNVVLNTEASRSRILDTDYAAETSEMAKQQIIQQAATAMLAQANQLPQTVLALLK